MRVCARVLAAALMTGAIAGAFALPSLVGQGVEEPRALPAPPSVKQRTLHLPAPKAPAESTIAGRRHVAHHAARPALIGVRIAPVKVHRTIFHPAASAGRSGLPSRSPAPSPRPAPKPRPGPAPAPAPSPAPSAPPERALAATSQPPVAPAPPVVAPATPPAASDEDNGHGNGHAYGHYKQADDGGQANANNGNNGNNGKGNGHNK